MLTKDANSTKGYWINQKTALLVVFCFMSLNSIAQCAMCRASLESEGNKAKGQAVNDGIVLLMAVPYVIAALLGFAIYRMYFRKKTA